MESANRDLAKMNVITGLLVQCFGKATDSACVIQRGGYVDVGSKYALTDFFEILYFDCIWCFTDRTFSPGREMPPL